MTQDDFNHLEIQIQLALDDATDLDIDTGDMGRLYDCIWIEVENKKTLDFLTTKVHLFPPINQPSTPGGGGGDDDSYTYLVTSEKPNRIVTAFVHPRLWAGEGLLLKRIKRHTKPLRDTVQGENGMKRNIHVKLIEGGKNEQLECKEGYFKVTLEIEEIGIQKLINNQDVSKVGKVAVTHASWVSLAGSGVEGMIRKKRRENQEHILQQQKKKKPRTKPTKNTKRTNRAPKSKDKKTPRKTKTSNDGKK